MRPCKWSLTSWTISQKVRRLRAVGARQLGFANLQKARIWAGPQFVSLSTKGAAFEFFRSRCFHCHVLVLLRKKLWDRPSAGINRHAIRNERVRQERSSESILT